LLPFSPFIQLPNTLVRFLVGQPKFLSFSAIKAHQKRNNRIFRVAKSSTPALLNFIHKLIVYFILVTYCFPILSELLYPTLSILAWRLSSTDLCFSPNLAIVLIEFIVFCTNFQLKCQGIFLKSVL
jgi:hypothetical protein